jgi:uncharacterized protein YbaR (Trm112 family)
MLPMDKNLFEILACPVCKGELIYDQDHQELICRFDRLAYPVMNGIPVMLESKARRMPSTEE